MGNRIPKIVPLPSCANLTTYIQGSSDYEILCAVVSAINQLIALTPINSITYANPFQWDITKQYAKNTLVLYTDNMCVYMSVDNVPVGVDIKNTEYWAVVCDMSDIYNQLVSAITSLQYSLFDTPAANNINVNELVWIDNELYKCTLAVNAGSNITKNSFEKTTLSKEFINLISNYNNEIENVTSELNARISNIIANGEQTEGNTELIDIRNGWDGVNYKTAGDAVRTQIADLHSDLFNLKMVNVFNNSDVTEGYSLRSAIGSDINSLVSNEKAFTANQIWRVKEGDIIRVSHPYMAVLIYDSSKKVIFAFNSAGEQFVVPKNGYYMRYSSVVTSENYLNYAMISINIALPNEYKPYGYVSFPTKETDDLQKQIDNLSRRKTAVILRFDGTGGIDFVTDPRYDMVYNEFGYRCSISVGYTNSGITTTKENFEKLIKNGVDFGIYSNNNPPPLSVISGKDAESIETCKSYVNSATEAVKEVGAYCPVTWFCRQSNSGYALEVALKSAGYMLASGIYYGDANSGLIEDASKYTLQTTSVYPSNMDKALSNLSEAIENGYDIAFLTHGFYDTEEEAEANYSCTAAEYRTLLNAVKRYVDEGKAEVVTYSEYIAMTKAEPELRFKENQRIANWIFEG